MQKPACSALNRRHRNPQVQPAIYVTYNGDYFDWPFIGVQGISLTGLG